MCSSDLGVLGCGGHLTYFAFDLIKLDGENITRLPLRERKTRLAALLKNPPPGNHRPASIGSAVLSLCRRSIECGRSSSPRSPTRPWPSDGLLRHTVFVELRARTSRRTKRGAKRLTGAAERLARACGLENGAVVERVDIRRGVATIADAIPNARQIRSLSRRIAK